ncbi:PTS sugar transporter subunit IIC [Sporosarcina newyorkensis]|uniref:PTS sugar transporter subunit IIC n=1 Tax=Sporosarcina newyorkensis TaxID=759851 RepID=UPI0003152B55|nr:PTS sugar transporter subunit IIC [Sporosarcina newyorkensis]
MEIIKGTVLLLIVLACFTLFSYKAPRGMKAMGALASAAIATFLVEAFQRYVGGDLLNIAFLGEVGDAAGSMGGVAAASLVALAMGVSPVYALMLGASSAGLGLLPGFIAGYLMSFVVKKIETKVPDGLDLIVTIIVAAPLVRLLGVWADPVVDATLLNIGGIITQSTDANPIIMGIILGGVITVVATAPLSSMALTAMLGLTGVPMAIGALAVFGSSFMNYVFFHRMKFGDRKTTISVAIEPLSQVDIISANPIPVYVTNFLGGASAGIIIALSGLINNATGTATPIAGFAVMYGFNDPLKVTIVALLCAGVGALWGYLGSLMFKNFKIRRVHELNIASEKIDEEKKEKEVVALT